MEKLHVVVFAFNRIIPTIITKFKCLNLHLPVVCNFRYHLPIPPPPNFTLNKFNFYENNSDILELFVVKNYLKQEVYFVKSFADINIIDTLLIFVKSITYQQNRNT